jgi:hypothetical protein
MRRILLALIALLCVAASAFGQAFNFPDSPTLNQQVTGPNGAIYQWDGTKWIAVGGGVGGGSGFTAGGDLSGTSTSQTVVGLQTKAVPTPASGYLHYSGTTFLWDTPAGGGGGTVNSVGLSGGTTGLTVAGSPITSSGTMTLGGTLAIASGGTGATTAPAALTNLGAAPIASPTFTGTVTIPAGASIAGFAPLASPVFTGTPSLPTGTIGVTQTAGTNNTTLATTAFVTAAVTAGTAGVSSFNTRTGAVTLNLADVTGVGGAPAASPTFTGTVTMPDGTTIASATGYNNMTRLGIGIAAPTGQYYLQVSSANTNYGTYVNILNTASAGAAKIRTANDLGHALSFGSLGSTVAASPDEGGPDTQEMFTDSNMSFLVGPANGIVRFVNNASTGTGPLIMTVGGAGGGGGGLTVGPATGGDKGAGTINASVGFYINGVAIGGGGVTSVGLSGGTTGLTVSGTPITTSGTMTLAGTLAVANGGLGSTTAPTAGQIPIAASGTVFTPRSISGDATIGSTGVAAVTGIRSTAIPTLASGYLQYTGSAFAWSTPPAALPAATLWTPSLTASTTNPTVTYTSRTGWLVNAGNGNYLFSVYISWTANSGGAGNATLSGLPISLAGETYSYMCHTNGVTMGTGNVEVGLFSGSGGNTFLIITAGNATGSTGLTQLAISAFGTTGVMSCQGWAA